MVADRHRQTGERRLSHSGAGRAERRGRAIAQAHPESHKNVGVALHGFRGTNPEDRSKFVALALLPAVPLAVLLIACANVASLLTARGVGRQREMATRAAVGASRGQLIAQLLAESLMLALVAGACSLLISMWAPVFS